MHGVLSFVVGSIAGFVLSMLTGWSPWTHWQWWATAIPIATMIAAAVVYHRHRG